MRWREAGGLAGKLYDACPHLLHTADLTLVPAPGDVPLFVEHWEAAIAELTLRGVGLTSKDAVS